MNIVVSMNEKHERKTHILYVLRVEERTSVCSLIAELTRGNEFIC